MTILRMEWLDLRETVANIVGHVYPSHSPKTQEDIEYAERFDELTWLFSNRADTKRDVRFLAQDAVAQQIAIKEGLNYPGNKEKEHLIEAALGAFFEDEGRDGRKVLQEDHGYPARHLESV